MVSSLTKATATAIAAVVVAAAEPAAAQQVLSPTQEQQIQSQATGQFPAVGNPATPMGLIQEKFANCASIETMIDITYQPDEMMAFNVRQVLGTVLQFPEPVNLMVKGVGDAIRVANYPAGSEQGASRLWVLGAHRTGTDGNLVFIAGSSASAPRLYHFRVQTEGVHSQNCPTTYVRVIGPTMAADRLAATVLETGLATGGEEAAVSESMDDETDQGPPASPGDGEDLTGRRNVDWLEGRGFDANDLSFDWRIYGEESMAPDAVFSDCCFTYLHYGSERVAALSMPAVSIVEKTAKGSVDAPVDWDVRGNTVVIRAIGRFTLEREGLVTCIEPTKALTALENDAQYDGDATARTNSGPPTRRRDG